MTGYSVLSLFTIFPVIKKSAGFGVRIMLPMVGMMGITSIYAGNPIGLIVTLVALARSYHLDKKKEISSVDWAYSLGKGGIISTISIVLMGILGPAIWISLITFIIVVILFNKSRENINWSTIGKSFYEFITGYLPTYSKV